MKIHNATPIVNPNNAQAAKTAASSVAFKGKGISDFFTLSRSGPMVRGLLVLNCFAFLLGTRLVTSRDKDEIRETMIRDVPSISIAILGVPFLSKTFAKTIQNKSGFALLKEEAKKDKKSLAEISYGQLESLYKYDDNLSSGFKGFSERLSGLNGNLKKIYSSLGENFESKLKNFDSDNKKFMNELFKKPKHSALVNELTNAFKDNKNAALKSALFKKTMTKVLGFTSTLLLIGICIPKLNIAITEALHRGDKNRTDKAKK